MVVGHEGGRRTNRSWGPRGFRPSTAAGHQRWRCCATAVVGNRAVGTQQPSGRAGPPGPWMARPQTASQQPTADCRTGAIEPDDTPKKRRLLFWAPQVASREPMPRALPTTARRGSPCRAQCPQAAPRTATDQVLTLQCPRPRPQCSASCLGGSQRRPLCATSMSWCTATAFFRDTHWSARLTGPVALALPPPLCLAPPPPAFGCGAGAPRMGRAQGHGAPWTQGCHRADARFQASAPAATELTNSPNQDFGVWNGGNRGKWRKMGGKWGNGGHSTRDAGCGRMWGRKKGQNTHFSQSHFPHFSRNRRSSPQSPSYKSAHRTHRQENGNFCHSRTLTATAASADACALAMPSNAGQSPGGPTFWTSTPTGDRGSLGRRMLQMDLCVADTRGPATPKGPPSSAVHPISKAHRQCGLHPVARAPTPPPPKKVHATYTQKKVLVTKTQKKVLVTKTRLTPEKERDLRRFPQSTSAFLPPKNWASGHNSRGPINLPQALVEAPQVPCFTRGVARRGRPLTAVVPG